MLKKDGLYFYDKIPVEYDCSPEERRQIIADYPTPVLPDTEEAFSLENEVQGNNIKVTLLLNDYSVEMTKTNKQFLKIRFSNNNGTFNAKMWDNNGEVDQYVPILDEYSVFTVEGRVEDYKGFKSITVYKMSPSKEGINPFSLLPYTSQDLEELTVELFSYIHELKSPYKEISLAAMNRFWKQFSIRPAAKGFHHNYLGGLLKHTVGLMRFARYILKFEQNHYEGVMKLINFVEKAHKVELWSQIKAGTNNPQNFVWKETIDHLYKMLYGMMQYQENDPNYDIVMTSILYHDIGKILEYDHAGKEYEEFSFLFPTATGDFSDRKPSGIIMDQLGVMIGHIPYGVLFFTRILEAEDISISMEELHAVSHCILCHHGLPEWGSCIRSPQTIEGYIVHIADYLDSRYENTEQVK